MLSMIYLQVYVRSVLHTILRKLLAYKENVSISNTDAKDSDDKLERFSTFCKRIVCFEEQVYKTDGKYEMNLNIIYS